MKRSSQVALLVGGLSVAGVGAYAMTPPRRDCVAPTQQPGTAGAVAPSPSGGVTMAPTPGAPIPGAPGAAVPGVGQPPTEPCKRSRRWGSWGPSYSSGDSRSSRTFWPGAGRTSTSGPVRTNVSSTSRSTTRTASSPTTSRGGFGSTGSSAGRSSS